jgi:DNA polymerase III alpha subunit
MQFDWQLKDTGGLINVVLWPEIYEVGRRALKSPFAVVEGQVQKREQAISIVARKVMPLQIETK